MYINLNYTGTIPPKNEKQYDEFALCAGYLYHESANGHASAWVTVDDSGIVEHFSTSQDVYEYLTMYD